ncbi:MAG: biotin--[acetyl-CoA-carboxylase] ligase [Anaerolineae bacterium]
MDDTLSEAAIATGLGTSWLARTIVYRPTTGSTNDDARRLALAGTPEGTLVVTDHQTAGRGRLQRRWLAPTGQALLFSVVFYPALDARDIFQLTMLASLAALEGIAEQTGLNPSIKWPNDLTLQGRKLAGILSELGQAGERLYAVVGIGINVNTDFSAVPDLQPLAISLSEVLGRPVPRVPLLQATLRRLETRYDHLRGGRSAYAEWRVHLSTLGQRVRVTSSDGIQEGVAAEVEPSGALVLALDDGTRRQVLAGDVQSLRPAIPGHEP